MLRMPRRSGWLGAIIVAPLAVACLTPHAKIPAEPSLHAPRTIATSTLHDKVLTLHGLSARERLLADRGAAGLWQKLAKLGTFASVLCVTAHPDDEDAGTLTYL